MAALQACSHVNTDNAESFGSLKKLVKQEERGMKTSVLKMASSTLSLSLCPSPPLPPSLTCSSVAVCLSSSVVEVVGGCYSNLPGGDCSSVQISSSSSWTPSL